MMNQEKRRRARVQGSWASNAPSSKLPTNQVPRATSSQIKTSDVTDTIQPTKHKFTFQTPTNEFKPKPKPTVIDKDGTYEISAGPNGESKVVLVKNIVKPELCEEYFHHFEKQIPWKQKAGHDKSSGEEYLQPRLTAWFGDHTYSYSGITQEPNQWESRLFALKQQVERFAGKEFNSMLANFYRDGKDHIPWHTDAQYRLGKLPTIASLTFGAVRVFELRKMLPKGSSEEDYECVEHYEVPLDAGTLLVMEGAVQEDWQHRVRKEYHDRGPRINFTFRSVIPPTD